MQRRRKSSKRLEDGSQEGHHTDALGEPLHYQSGRPLFPKRIKGIEGLLSREVRGRVERVVLIVNRNSLSLPVIYASRITPALFDNFPNAEIVSDNQVAGLYKAPDGRSATVLEGRFTDSYGRFRGRRDRSICMVVGPKVVGSPSWNRALDGSCCLTVDFDSFGIADGGMLHVLKDGITTYSSGFKRGLKIREIEVAQDSTLKHLGFDKLPPAGHKAALTPDRYSDRLNSTIKELSALVESQASGLPLVFVNTFKGMTGSCIPRNWVKPISGLLETGDVAVAVNEGPPIWQRGFSGGVDELYSLLSDIPHQENLLRLGPNDVTRLAAILHLVKETGGCLVDVQTGTTHLADWMNTPEVVYALDARYLRTRKNLIKVRAKFFEKIPEAVAELIRRGH